MNFIGFDYTAGGKYEYLNYPEFTCLCSSMNGINSRFVGIPLLKHHSHLK
jgi:hypothetical protein